MPLDMNLLLPHGLLWLLLRLGVEGGKFVPVEEGEDRLLALKPVLQARRQSEVRNTTERGEDLEVVDQILQETEDDTKYEYEDSENFKREFRRFREWRKKKLRRKRRRRRIMRIMSRRLEKKLDAMGIKLNEQTIQKIFDD